MRCVICGGTTHVVYTRFVLEENQVKRRRECVACKKRFISSEVFHHAVGERTKKHEPRVAVQEPKTKKTKVRSDQVPRSTRKLQDKKRVEEYGVYEADDGSLSEEEMRGLGISVNRSGW